MVAEQSDKVGEAIPADGAFSNALTCLFIGGSIIVGSLLAMLDHQTLEFALLFMALGLLILLMGIYFLHSYGTTARRMGTTSPWSGHSLLRAR